MVSYQAYLVYVYTTYICDRCLFVRTTMLMAFYRLFLKKNLSLFRRFLSPGNQRVTDTLIDHVFADNNGVFSIKDIKRSAHRYYESRRRLGIEDLPDRQVKAAEQRKRRKYRARQQRTYDRLGKVMGRVIMATTTGIANSCSSVTMMTGTMITAMGQQC